MSEDVHGSMSNGVVPSFQVSGVALHEYELLLRRAEEEIDKSEYSLSVIMSHAAIEIFTERAFKLLFSFKGIEYLYEAIIKPSWKYNNLSDEKALRLFSALSGETFDKESPLWKELVNHFKRRNKIAHKGVSSTKEEAELSVKVAKRYVEYINDILEKTKPPNWGT
jgi:HEPN domain-containing protein